MKLIQSHLQTKVEIEVEDELRFHYQPGWVVVVGGGWVLDFTKLMQSHLSTKVEVEVEDELGKINILRITGYI